MKLSVVIPCYNERPTVREIVRRVIDAPVLGLEKEILLIDDCSTDGTRELLQQRAAERGVVTILRPSNRGKGAALLDGFAGAT